MARRSFWPTVLVGLVGALLTAVAGHKSWVSLHSSAASIAGTSVSVTPPASDAPAVTALALVVLAAWGVVLVTRGPVRRVVAGLAAVAALGALAAAVGQFVHVKHTVSGSYASAGASHVELGYTAWPFLALLGVVVAVVAAVLAVLLAPRWPEMGTKYDAPVTAAPVEAPLEEQSSLDLWKSLDEGHDPTRDQD